MFCEACNGCCFYFAVQKQFYGKSAGCQPWLQTLLYYIRFIQFYKRYIPRVVKKDDSSIARVRCYETFVFLYIFMDIVLKYYTRIELLLFCFDFILIDS